MFPPGWAGRASTALVLHWKQSSEAPGAQACRVRSCRATNRLQVGFGEHRMLVRSLSARSGKGLTFSSTPKAPKVGHEYPCFTETQGSS